MLQKIRGYFGSDGGDISLLDASEHVRLAVAVVLISSARSDTQFVPAEREMLVKQLQYRLGITPEEAQQLEAQAEVAEEHKLLRKYAETLRAELSIAQREFLLTLAWGLIGVDKLIAKDESRFSVELRTMLGLSLEQSLRARKAAEGLHQDGFKEYIEASRDVQEGIKSQLDRLHQKPGSR